MAKVGLLVKLVAKAGQEEALGAFLTSARPLAEAEAFTTSWFAFKADASTFYIFDTFDDDGGRQKHLAGPIAAALMAKAPELLASPPEIGNVDVLADKLPR
ncbi:MAG: antibiotic biosynthesis monooxygenase [Myxococcales bacterium]|nr:MAG: antibiotic biosynthesis monooxygenase [Myxococcales bacterium]